MVGYSNGLPVQSLARETLVFSLGSTLLHSAACVINDICDRDFDAQVGEYCDDEMSGRKALKPLTSQRERRLDRWSLAP